MSESVPSPEAQPAISDRETDDTLANSDAASSQRMRRSPAEWVTFGIATCILVALVGLILYDWLLSQNRPPAFQVEPIGEVQMIQSQYYLPFAITNTGGNIARSVQVVAELHLSHEPDETGEQQIDFLSGGEQKRGSFIFNHDPRTGELILRVASYRLP